MVAAQVQLGGYVVTSSTMSQVAQVAQVTQVQLGLLSLFYLDLKSIT